MRAQGRDMVDTSSRSSSRFMLNLILILAAIVGLSLAPSRAAAADFFAGKTINFIVGTDVTGGFSIYGRLISRHLGRHIPGNPTLVFKNMPGAGSSTAGVYLYKMAPKDGTTIGALTPNAIVGKLMEEAGQVQFEPTKFQYLAGAERGTRLCMSWHTSKIRTFDDALTQKAIIGATAAGGPTREYAAWHKHATGAKFEIVSGYKGPGDLFLAMERGEIDGVCGLDWTALQSQQPDWLRDKKLNLLVQDGIEPEPELTALGVPQPWGYMKDPTDREAVELMVGFEQAFGKAYLLPPDVPAEQVRTLRNAFNAVLRDGELLAEAEKLRIKIAPQTGEQVQKVVENLYSAPKPVVDRLKKIIEP
jgi:tripartite-type tricarboxylate transporter receptor subunit TctC